MSPARSDNLFAMLHARFRPSGAAAVRHLFFLPSLLLVGLVSFVPLGYALAQSFFRSKYFAIGRFAGIQNYIDLFTGDNGVGRLINTIIFVAGSLAIAMPLGIALALALNTKIWCRDLLRSILFLPWLISTLVAAMLWSWLLNAQFGPVAAAAAALGISFPSLFTSPSLAMPTVVAVSAWYSYPLVMVFVLAALQTIPADLYEAAQIDGANALQRFAVITLPLIKNTILVSLVLTSLAAFNGVTLLFVMTGGGPIGRTETIALKVLQEGTKFYRMGLASAGSIVLFALNLAVTVAYAKVLRGSREGA